MSQKDDQALHLTAYSVRCASDAGSRRVLALGLGEF